MTSGTLDLAHKAVIRYLAMPPFVGRLVGLPWEDLDLSEDELEAIAAEVDAVMERHRFVKDEPDERGCLHDEDYGCPNCID